MRILILTEEQYPFLVGGGTTINRLLEKYLNENNIDYNIFCPRWRIGAKYQNKRVKAMSFPLTLIRNKYLRQLYKIPYILSWYLSTLFYLLFIDKRYDLIFVQENTFSGYFALFLRKIFKIKVCFGEQSPGDLTAIKEKLGLPNQAINLLEKTINNFRKRADYIIYASRDACNKYKPLNKNSIFIPNFIDFNKFTKKVISNKIKNIGFSGRICFDKKVDLMIKTMKHFPKLNLILIGKGPPEEEEQIRRLAKDLKLKNVHFRGFTKEIDKALNEVDILLMLWEKESFGIAALESMAKGIPVIAADVQEMHYFIGKSGAGITIKKVDEENLKKAISRISKSKPLYKRLSDKSIKVAKEYDYKKVLNKYLDIFKKTAQK